MAKVQTNNQFEKERKNNEILEIIANLNAIENDLSERTESKSLLKRFKWELRQAQKRIDEIHPKLELDLGEHLTRPFLKYTYNGNIEIADQLKLKRPLFVPFFKKLFFRTVYNKDKRKECERHFHYLRKLAGNHGIDLVKDRFWSLIIITHKADNAEKIRALYGSTVICTEDLMGWINREKSLTYKLPSYKKTLEYLGICGFIKKLTTVKGLVGVNGLHYIYQDGYYDRDSYKHPLSSTDRAEYTGALKRFLA